MTPHIVKVTMEPPSAKDPVLPDFAYVDPSTQAQNALPFAAQVQTNGFGVVEARHLTEPAQ